MSDDLLAVAVEAARAAGAVLLERAGAPRGVTTKSTPTDLVSDADLAAERAIRDVLRERRPGDAILGEEGGDVAGTTGVRWVVDPLDGTVNFLFGLPQWCVSVACEGRAAARVGARGAVHRAGGHRLLVRRGRAGTAGRGGIARAAAGGRHPAAGQRGPGPGVDGGGPLRRVLRARRVGVGHRGGDDAV